jgi:hypothetical protein
MVPQGEGPDELHEITNLHPVECKGLDVEKPFGMRAHLTLHLVDHLEV